LRVVLYILEWNFVADGEQLEVILMAGKEIMRSDIEGFTGVFKANIRAN